MLIKCVSTDPRDLNLPPSAGYTVESVFHLTIGAEYVVLGLGLFGQSSDAFLFDDTGFPNWMPLALFEAPVQSVPEHWEFAAFGPGSSDERNYRWFARWGYPELVRDQGHVDAAINRDPAALELAARELEVGLLLHDRGG